MSGVRPRNGGGPGSAGRPGLLERVLDGTEETFALLHRPPSRPATATGSDSGSAAAATATAAHGTVEVLTGTLRLPTGLAELPVPPERNAGGSERHDVLAVVPYRQIRERGFAHVDDGAPLLALEVGEQETVPLPEALARIPDTGIALADGGFDRDDDAYARTVRRVVGEEIGQGEGANFVLKRTFSARIEAYAPHRALTLFRRLLVQEQGAYWTFLVHTPRGTFVGASPERHVSLRDGRACMNPVSGTYRYPASGPDPDGVLDFLADRKEAEELYMVVDEELKMMARVCDSVPRVTGPGLKEMARLAHTEYVIEGHSSQDPREILRETLFAPTVTGSPLENACRVIARHEPEGRGHYSGVLALIGRDGAGARTLDSSILIRTAEISPTGQLRIATGATLVRHSDPASEAAETRAKASGLLHALGPQDPAERPAGSRPAPAAHPAGLTRHGAVRAALAARNTQLSGFWLGTQPPSPTPELAGLDVLVVDAEDTFTAMLAHQIRALGPSATVRPFDDPGTLTGHDVVVMGPGPGDPQDEGHPRIAALRRMLRRLLEEQRPFLAVCLSHQLLSLELGLPLVRRASPNQGARRSIDLFGHTERVGFYNTFAARADQDKAHTPAGTVEVSRDARTGEVHALRGRGFATLQFHPESLLTRHGVPILARTLKGVLGG